MRLGVLIAGGIVVGGLAAALSSAWNPSPSPVGSALLAVLAFAAGALLSRLGAVGSAAAPDRSDSDALEAARCEGVRARADVDALQRSISHDLRSPVGAVLNFSVVLEEDHGDQLDPEARAILARIRRSAESAIAILDGVVRLSRVEKAPFRPELVDTEALVRELFAELRAARPDTELALDALPPVRADAILLRTAFGELLANAIKFSAGREKARVAVGGRRDPDGTLVYWVADDGAGFDMRFAHKLFRSFERLHSRDEFPGAGVGLAMVRRVAERHGGRVWAEAEPERGARFFVALPAAGGT